MTKDKWVWMPHPGHFIGSRSCQFVLSTCVGNYVVSTVGEYAPASRDFVTLAKEEELKEVPEKYREWFRKMRFEILGYTRFYETMVFKAVKDEENSCCPYKAIVDGGELDFAGYNDPMSAYEGHLKLCSKWAKKK